MSAQIVSFRCTLKDRFGHVISTSVNQNVSTDLQGGSQAGLVGLVREMQNLTKGERREIFVHAQDAYGYYDPTRIHTIAAEEWPIERQPFLGMEVSLPDGLLYRVIEIRPDEIVLDANHPLAGQDLIFDIEATDVRLDDGSEEDRFEEEEIEVGQPEVELRNEKGPREIPATLPVFH
ncbi:MAG: FKBP-type peptidyl-prolyl cis-trans isomerase [Bdellovibrionaceae bacterium]|nr:FKBP-type peptidyl-prolyl cis-trans isomerase [Pseudobdellovibrionaceae bacterium]